ncbi:sce7726 family protein [Vibrio vulnificus]|uniref:sce7726 family protein n=1 Tax=Vibrio vulnificus TaxID=672 RepID=UPI00111DA923
MLQDEVDWHLLMTLNDPEIRIALKEYLLRLPTKPQVILEELHVHKGNAIADLVAVYKEPHCYEIKGDNDNITRIEKQGFFYNLVFNKITLVTTQKHLNNALSKAPAHWGIIVVSRDDCKFKIKHHRKASNNPFFNKEKAIQTLWRQEMISIIQEQKLDISLKLNKTDLASNLASLLNKGTIHTNVAKMLTARSFAKAQSH